MRSVWVTLLLCLFSLGSAPVATAAETRLTVEVLSADTGKPVDRASVVVVFKHGLGVNLRKVRTNWETKTNQDGKVTIPAMPRGEVQIQIIAANFQTFGGVYQTTDAQQTITIKINRPQPQYSEDDKKK
jgi:5-hydroxyisourate hydrolase-like protein (transthyretin family)